MTTSIALYNADCRAVLPQEADVIITDPPYAVTKKGEMLGQIAPNYKEKGTHTRGYADHDPQAFSDLLVPAFDLMLRSVPKGGLMLAWCGNRTLAQMVTYAERTGWQMLDLVVFTGGGSWAKSKSMLAPRHETAALMRRPGGIRNFNSDRTKTNHIHLPKTRGESEHPTTKPQTWMRAAVEAFTQPGEVILDPFAGSGSTLIAALATGRGFVGIEKDADFAALAARRVGEELRKSRY